MNLNDVALAVLAAVAVIAIGSRFIKSAQAAPGASLSNGVGSWMEDPWTYSYDAGALANPYAQVDVYGAN